VVALVGGGPAHAARRIVSAPAAVARPLHAHPLQGVALILLAAACFASLDSTARGLSQPDGRWGVPVLLIMTLRYTIQAAVMAVALAPRRRASFQSAHPRFQ